MDTNDIISLVMTDLYENPQKYDSDKGTVKTYIHLLARTHTLNSIKKSGRNLSELTGDEVISVIASRENPDDEAGFNELIRIIASSLNKKEKTLFAMRYLYYYTPEEISISLKIKRSAVDMRLSRLREKVRKILTAAGYSTI